MRDAHINCAAVTSASVSMSIHGSRPGDMQTRLDGMNINATGSFGGGFRHQGLNQAAIQETVVETDGSTAAR